MKLKIIQAGWAGYTGEFGGEQFVDGISVNELSPYIAQRISACVQCEDADDGSSHNPAHIVTQASKLAVDQNMVMPDMTQVSHQGGTASSVNTVPMTREDFEAIATEKGISGLRELIEAKGLEIRGNSIVAIIDKLTRSGLTKEVTAEPAAEPTKVAGDDTTVETGAELTVVKAIEPATPTVTAPVVPVAAVVAAVAAGGAPGSVPTFEPTPEVVVAKVQPTVSDAELDALLNLEPDGPAADQAEAAKTASDEDDDDMTTMV
jgi:hypothetical protein